MCLSDAVDSVGMRLDESQGRGGAHAGGTVHSGRACAPRVTSPRRPGTVLQEGTGFCSGAQPLGRLQPLDLRKVPGASTEAEAPSSDSGVD